MRRAIRENALCVLMAAAGSLAVAWLGLGSFAWNDYDTEARHSVELILDGRINAFLAAAPVYGGSLIERAPFAFLAQLWGGGSLAVYRMLAVPALLAAAGLGVWLVAGMRREGYPVLARAVTLCVCVANPITLAALELGHPEELLGGCLCVAAVLLACASREGRAHPLLAGVCLGLAIANKDWAILAAGPVLLALPARRRMACLIGCAVTAAALMAPLALAASSRLLGESHALASAQSPIFEPWQIWWFLGHHGALVRGATGAKPGYRIGPGWIESHSHVIVVLAGFALAAALWLRGRLALRTGQGGAGATRERSSAPLGASQALLALALVLLLRCMLDTWDFAYYPLPFVLALLVWELSSAQRRPPVLTLAATLLVWVSFEWLPAHVSPDAQAAFFLAWSLPLAVWMTARLFWPARAARASRLGAGRPAGAQEITVSALGRPVRTS
jgi:hypothetical protein